MIGVYTTQKSSHLSSGAYMLRILRGIVLAVAAPATIHAAAFAVYEQSASYLGNAYAGTSSAVQDASTSYYNPAGLKYLGKDQIVVSAVYSNSQVKLSNANALDSAGDVIGGLNPTKPSSNTLIPGVNIAFQVNERVALGFSVVELFATNLKYPGNSIARYMATTTKISTVNISPSIGIMFNKKLHIGAALDVLKANMNISSAVAWGDVGQEAFGYVNNNMHDWATGFHAGILFIPTKALKMGLVYFSSFSLSLQGSTISAETLDFGRPNRATSSWDLPDQINYSLTYDVNKKFTSMLEVAWTHWSKIKTIYINYNSSALPGVLAFNFKNSLRVAAGGDYKFNSKFTLKAGISFDQTPLNNDHKTVRIPENNRYIAALGFRYTFNKFVSLVGAYSYTYMNNYTIHETAATDSLNNSPNVSNVKNLNGNIRNFNNKIGLQMVCTASLSKMK